MQTHLSHPQLSGSQAGGRSTYDINPRGLVNSLTSNPGHLASICKTTSNTE